MTSRQSRILLIGLAVAIIVAWAWLGRSGAGARPLEPVDDLPTRSVPQPQPVAIERAKVEPAARAVVAQAGDESVAPAGPPARVRGRCVDVEGAAMTGATVTLNGILLPQRSQRWTWDNAPMRWRNPEPIVTTHDGRFEFEFLAPSTHFFSLVLRASDHVEMHCHWQVIHAGDDVNLGDVTLLAGCRVAGRVRDTDYVAREGIRVQLDFEGQFPKVTHGGAFKIVSGPGGEFAFTEPIPTGRWSVHTGQYPRVEPHQIEVQRGETTKHLDVVVAAPADVQKIEGIVVDAVGESVAKARLAFRGVEGKGRWVRSGADGSFVLMKPLDDPDEPVGIRVTKTGHQVLRIDPVAWGTRDLIFRLPRGVRVHVAVVRTEDSSPVESYTATIYPTRDHTWSGWGLQTAVGGRHRGGRTALGPLRSGKYLLMVEPAEEGLAMSGAVLLEMVATDVQRTVALPRAYRRQLELRSASGAPVGVARVELIEPVHDQITLQTRAYPVLKWRQTIGASKALLHQLLETDGNGRGELVGPPRDLVLRIQTFECGQRIITGVRLDGPGKLVITLDLSATLRGTVDPIPAIEELRLGIEEAHFGPRIELRRTAPEPTVFPPSSGDGGSIDSSGAYRIGGIPAGLWDVHLTWNTVEGVVVRTHTRRLTQVGLSRAQDVVLDLSVPQRDK